MVAYLIGQMAVHDPEGYRMYLSHVTQPIKKHRGKFPTRGDGVSTLEGDAFLDRMVIIEFPSKEAVDELYEDPEYITATKYRHASDVSRVLVQEARDNSEIPKEVVQSGQKAPAS